MISDLDKGEGRIAECLTALERYVIREGYRGYDPYDCLTSPLFRLPVLRSSKLLRFSAQQVFRRVPWNVRPLVGIKKGYNPVTLGLALQAYSYLLSVFPDRKTSYEREINHCIGDLSRLRSTGYSGSCWGYDFDWEGRYAHIPAFTPTVVATGIICNALYECFKVGRVAEAFELCRSSPLFVMIDLQRTYVEDTLCFSYSPKDSQQVFNASMKGVRLLVQVWSITQDAQLLDTARRGLEFVVQLQQENGSWPYARDARTWADGYHTAYILDCIAEYIRLTREDQYQPYVQKGLDYYRENFFLPDGTPKYYDRKVYPIDSTCGAQAIITLSRFGYLDQARTVALWMIKQMFNSSGYFHYQRQRWFTHRTSYMRWSNAWMLCALAYHLYKSKTP